MQAVGNRGSGLRICISVGQADGMIIEIYRKWEVQANTIQVIIICLSSPRDFAEAP